MTPVQLNLLDIFNHLKVAVVYEMGKAQKSLCSSFTGGSTDVEKIASQGKFEVCNHFYNILTEEIKRALSGEFDFKVETQKLLEAINELDPYLMYKAQLVTDNSGATEANAEEKKDAVVEETIVDDVAAEEVA